MLAKTSAWIQRNMPTREQMQRSRWTRPFANRIMRSELWRFTRRSVPRGVALGMLVGIIIPFAQILFSALLCLPVRANVPVAALTTFVTNPITTPLIWILSYNVGSWMLRVDAATVIAPVNKAMEHSEFGDMLQWLTGATLVTAFGLVVVAAVAAAASYVATSFSWRYIVAAKRRRRLMERRIRRGSEEAEFPPTGIE
ncbi:hypothetical protein A6F68_01360 [Tsuneonella dongtanensis]|uniref:DUF2062 domain-containing protein n=1 Tax=Tsuneonella dongtanensis TaxID=692370 RepID=A0A1B2ACL3_9SPHN|nr:DUF2062 domain-containing protein [Tsuneonella dongtanensis]ANY19877.1 hypothetical protein A6F68_01360 [Tsuneonella dongtanensis]